MPATSARLLLIVVTVTSAGCAAVMQIGGVGWRRSDDTGRDLHLRVADGQVEVVDFAAWVS